MRSNSGSEMVTRDQPSDLTLHSPILSILVIGVLAAVSLEGGLCEFVAFSPNAGSFLEGGSYIGFDITLRTTFSLSVYLRVKVARLEDVVSKGRVLVNVGGRAILRL